MMKYIAASYLLLRCSSAAVDKGADRTGRGSIPRLRAGAVVEAAKKEKRAGKNSSGEKPDEAGAASMTGRERISRYTQEKQMFFVIDGDGDPMPFLYEDPDSEPKYFTVIQWLCAPVHAPDINGDGMFDSLVAHVVSFLPDSDIDEAKDSGATVAGSHMTHGYSANWNDAGGYYDEVIADYDDSSVENIRGSAVTFYETSPAGGRGGFTGSGAGVWTFDASHPLVEKYLAGSLGVGSDELTPELCAETYAEVWSEANDPPSTRDE